MSTKYEIEIGYDKCPENPNDFGCEFTHYSFSKRHYNYKDPNSFDEQELQDMLNNGKAFLLSYYKHGQCIWSLLNELPLGAANDPWDSVKIAGILMFDGDDNTPIETRQKNARDFIKIYTQWCNGEVYYFSLYNLKTCPHCSHEEREFIDRLSGFYDKESLISEIDIEINQNDELRITGEASWLVDKNDFCKNK